ncbi:substrate-binding periplasmic protein [Pigmentibacter ruber]|uniref:substrate-binding periplasmic protein n=1 Tax=Pigmentibacter ruber TaxID=2683196 RepID=UPI00131C15F8|nr:transporter substrate-binding domain-containing protein [Pigmentibacter ruber]
MFYKIFFLKFIILLSQILSFEIYGKSVLPECNREFTAKVYENGLFYMADKKSGIDYDLLKELEKRSGCKFVITAEPRARIWYELENGKLDFATSGIPTTKREEYSYFSNFVSYKKSILIRKETNIKSMQDFMANKNLIFGTIISYKDGSKKIDNMLDLLRQEKRVEESTSQELMYKKLATNRIQAVIGSILNYKIYFEKFPNLKDDIEIYDWFPEEKSANVGIVISKKTINEIERQSWDTLIKEMVVDGTVLKIFKKYLTDDDFKKLINFKVWKCTINCNYQ